MAVDEATRKALDVIKEAESRKPPEGPVVLSKEYLRLIERVENLPQNRPGTDKAWVERVVATWKYEVENAREVLRE
jgi:hypothetical protein